MEKIIIIGISGHAKVLIDIIEKENKYEIVGLTDKFYVQGTKVLGYPVLGKDEDIPEIIKLYSVSGGIIAVGNNYLRSIISEKIKEIYPAFTYIKIIHPSAQIAKDVTIGEGTVVMSGVIVNPSTIIGSFCILNTGSSIDHDSFLGNFASLAPGVRTGGNCKIGNYSALGIGSILLHGVNIGEHTVIGASSTVFSNIGTLKVAYGTPAKIIREREKNENYL